MERRERLRYYVVGVVSKEKKTLENGMVDEIEKIILK